MECSFYPEFRTACYAETAQLFQKDAFIDGPPVRFGFFYAYGYVGNLDFNFREAVHVFFIRGRKHDGVACRLNQDVLQVEVVYHGYYRGKDRGGQNKLVQTDEVRTGERRGHRAAVRSVEHSA